MIRARLLLIVPLLLAGCGGAEDDAEPRANSVEELSNRLDKLADRTTEEIEPPDRLGVLEPADLEPRLRVRPACELHKEGRLYLLVNASGAVARIDGRRVPLVVSGPVGPTGGFFTAPGLTVSVGRTAPPGQGADENAREWPASVTVGGDKERPIEKHDGSWICAR